MACKIAYKKSVARDLKKIDKTQVEKILQKIEQDLPGNAKSLPVLSGKFAGLRKFRVGEYRVIFSVVEDTALILRIKHCRNVYR